MDARAFARAHDAYLDPDRYYRSDYEAPVRHCGRCGAFLAQRPDHIEPWEEVFECDGTVTVHPEPYTEGLIAILGEEYRGQTYDVSVSACGVDLPAHEPHVEIMAAGDTAYRTCRRCGHLNIESY